MSSIRAIGALIVLAVVLIVAGLAAGALHRSGDPVHTAGSDAAAGSGSSATSTAVRVVDPSQVPELRGRPAQHDVDQDTPAARSYERTHRLLEQLPQTYRGVSFDSAGRTQSGRVRVTANPNGLPAAETQRIYRRLLARTHDPGHWYRLVVVRPDAHSP